MEQNRNPLDPEAPADELASTRPGDSYFSPPGEENRTPPREKVTVPSPTAADCAEPPLLSDCLAGSLDDALLDTFPSDGRKPRHDGWTPEAVAGFLRDLAATGVVEHAARAVGLSAQSAYNLRNRRQGRAFAKMWDAVLIHRSRSRVASELHGRSVAGCVSIRKRDGVVVGEYHYYDNRLAMAMLTRLDRLAEREAASETHLRALAEDLDDFIDCIAQGGDADAFVDARRASEAAHEPVPAAAIHDPEAAHFDSRSPGGEDEESAELDVSDLDPDRKAEWTPDQWQRAHRSGYLGWLGLGLIFPHWAVGRGSPLRFLFARDGAYAAAVENGGRVPDPRPDDPSIMTFDLDPRDIGEWSDEALARAWRSGLLRRLPSEFWDDLAGDAEEEEPGE